VERSVVTDRMSIALMGTSSTVSPRCIAYPTASAIAIVSPRLHQLKPSQADKPSASRTPVTTAITRVIALRIVWYNVTCATSSAVSGASTGRGVTVGTSSASK
jgi:hypothetical protein